MSDAISEAEINAAARALMQEAAEQGIVIDPLAARLTALRMLQHARRAAYQATSATNGCDLSQLKTRQ